MSKSLPWLMIALFVGSASGCDEIDEGHACSAVGCASGVSVRLNAESGTLADGDYSLVVGGDGTVSNCSFVVPQDLPQPGTGESIACGDEDVGLNVLLWTECVSVDGGCQPGNNYVTVEVQSTPQRLAITARRDNRVLLDEQLELTYRAYSPNGPECGPTCWQPNEEIDDLLIAE